MILCSSCFDSLAVCNVCGIFPQSICEICGCRCLGYGAEDLPLATDWDTQGESHAG